MDDQNMHIDETTTRFPEDQSPEDLPATGDRPESIGGPDRPNGELGFSLSELLIAIAIIGILSVVVIGELQSAIEKAKLSACLANMVTIREEVWANCDGGMDFPDRDELWGGIFKGNGPKGYWYALDNDDPNKGHGNDLDGFDEQNPGNAPRKDNNIYFVLACEHDHGRLADYVFLEDAGSPQIAQKGDKPPIWYKFYRKDSAPGGPPGGGKPPKPPKK
jgi:prepilin-type N-terminal cleavage/methylation domain-containing protein